jgi:hypothetical protein
MMAAVTFADSKRIVYFKHLMATGYTYPEWEKDDIQGRTMQESQYSKLLDMVCKLEMVPG